MRCEELKDAFYIDILWVYLTFPFQYNQSDVGLVPTPSPTTPSPTTRPPTVREDVSPSL